MCVKVDKMFDNVKKMTCLGVLERGARGDDNETGLKEEGGIEMSTTVLHGLKEGGGIEMSTTVLSIYAMLALLRFLYYTYHCLLP